MVIFINAKTNRAICAGTLVNSEFVLTAAHCSLAWMEQHVHLIAGVSRQDLRELERVHLRATESLYTHPNYFLISHDLMLVKLNKAVDEADNVEYVKLPWGDTSSFETTCANPLLMGWSMGSNSVSEDDLKLLCANLKLYPLDKCRADYKKYPDLTLDDQVMQFTLQSLGELKFK
nr:unnamed protein product [Callosobruchus analis]